MPFRDERNGLSPLATLRFSVRDILPKRFAFQLFQFKSKSTSPQLYFQCKSTLKQRRCFDEIMPLFWRFNVVALCFVRRANGNRDK